ncbi:MAG: 2-oxoacid:acceptor oxidoreductase subunit alpha [Dehalococcoidia bacterium]|nr:2-oxoacid:acceptor oxidoreductase subunit alpha [Dehalococcoidia bacterium]MDD5494984.1 2-oxoacid:acceptor oxidoreductase subunit alpha [Dehalococcoidia bacterium]
MALDLRIVVGGEAGQGAQTIGFILAKAFARLGCHVFADQDYESRIRGGHNFFRIRVRDSHVSAVSEVIDILVALNRESLSLHCPRLGENGVAIADMNTDPELVRQYGILTVPLSDLAAEKAGNKLMANSVAIGSVMGMLGFNSEILSGVIKDHFQSSAIVENNIKAARAGYDYARQRYDRSSSYDLSSIMRIERMLLNGNESVALGAMAAGCKFLAAYPMTPSTPIIEFMAANAADFATVVIQPEDEIAAIHMAIGAAYSGVRAMTVTSGGGFSLMVEALGLSGMTETPVVIVEGQRAGPAIGLPTRTEQGDLLFAVNASHGEFPRAVFAPSCAEDGFWLTIKAFNMAEKYQIPVIVMTDHHLASSYFTAEKFDLSGVYIDRGLPLSEDEMGKLSEYKRHRITPSGISPRALPMQSHALVVTDSDEHSEAGHIIEDAETRTRMVAKRMKKLEGLRRDMAPPHVFGPKTADISLVGWGSSFGALHEAMGLLRQQGLNINLVHFTEVWPLPAQETTDLLGGDRKIYVAENNATGQFARLLNSETGLKISGTVLKYDGRPFTSQYIIDRLKGMLP